MTTYKIEFSVCGKVLASNTVTATNNIINYAIPQDITLMPIVESVVGIQVIGNNGENIIKSPIVEAYIGSSLQDSTIVASDVPPSATTQIEQLMVAKHTHANKSVLDKFAEGSDGKPTYNGVAIGGGSGSSGGGASTAEEVSYTNEQMPNVSNVKAALDEAIVVQQTHEDDIVAIGESLDDLTPKAHTHANKVVLDLISDANGKLQYNGSDVGLKGDTGAPGAPGADGKTPIKGTDYWTAADKAEIVADTLAALPTWTGGSY